MLLCGDFGIMQTFLYIQIFSDIMAKKSVILFVLTAFFVFSSVVSADVIVPGEKYVPWCYEISNINSYPDYVFVFNEERVTGPKVINQGDCFDFYKIGLTSIYAIKKSEFNEGELNKEFFKKGSPKLIKSNLQLSAFASVKENDPLENIVITLDITSLSQSKFDVKKSKITYTYNDGTSEVKVFQTQDIPNPSRNAVLPWWFAKFWYIILPIAAVLLIGIILLIRRLRR